MTPIKDRRVYACSETCVFCIGGTKPHGIGGVWGWSQARGSNINRKKE